MQNDPTKRTSVDDEENDARRFAVPDSATEESADKHTLPGRTRNHRRHSSKSTSHSHRRSLSKFLLDSDIKPVVFMGKCAQFFGWGAVAGFFLGMAFIYFYAVFYEPLPLAKVAAPPFVQPTPPPAPQPKTVQLRGLVRNSADEPAKWFNVGVFANQQGPLNTSDGSFKLDVPQSSSYDVVYWIDDETVGFFRGNPAEPDGNGYKLQNVLKFSPKNQYTSAVPRRTQVSTSRAEVGRLESRGY